MAQDVQIANVQYSDVPALEVPKVGGGTARFTDLSGDTLDANKVLAPYTGHDATGAPSTGTYIPPSGAISVVDTPDSHGGTVRTITAVDISDTTAVASDVASGKYFYTADGTKTAGTASGGGGGLEYESGTWTPSEDVADEWISFSNTHSTTPFYYAIWDDTGTYDSTTYSNYAVVFYSGELMSLSPLNMSSNTFNYARASVFYRSSNATMLTGTTYGISSSDEDSTDNSYGYSRYWAKPTGIKATTTANDRYWRSTRTYKWIAVWAPTT